MEGYFVRTVEDLIFEIKGVVHPQDRRIAYLRYVPMDGTYRKIYNLHERASYLQQFYPHYLWHSRAHGRVVQCISKGSVKEVLNPVNRLAELRETGEKSKLQRTAVALSDTLVRLTGISHRSIGVTGSILTGTASDHSDIDLVVYGEQECRMLHSQLRQSFDVTPDMRPYSGVRLSQHVEFRWPGLVQHYDALKSIEKNKLLQGLYRDTDFFIRLVKLPNEISDLYAEQEVRYLGQHHLQCRITNSDDSIFTPCEYEVDNDSSSVGISRLVSYRGRFTEHASLGEIVNVRGRLELVKRPKTAREYYQIVLGEDSQDFLLPS